VSLDTTQKILSENISTLEKLILLLDKIKEYSIQLTAVEEQVRLLKEDDEEDRKTMGQIALSLRELETSFVIIKQFLNNSLKWIIGIVTISVSLLVSLLGYAAYLIIEHIKPLIK